MSSKPLTTAALRGAVDLSALKRPAGAAGPPGVAAPPGAPADGAAPADDLVVQITDQSFQQVVNASVRHPVVVVLYSARLTESGSFVGVLADVARANEGRFQVAAADVDANPGLLRAFQVQSVPAVLGLIQGQPVPLFVGVLSAPEVQPWIDELLKLAVQYGVTGRVTAGDAPTDAQPPDADGQPPLSPHHEAAYDAIERGDLDGAVAAYRAALAADPTDTDAALGLGQVQLMQRTQGADLTAARAAAAADPADLDAQLLVADLDVLGGHVDDAFARLVDVVRATSGDDRDRVRQHLLGLFEVVGAQDPRVVKGRRALMSALF